MTARHVPKHCFQPTRLNGVIIQNITMRSPQFIASCCHVFLLLTNKWNIIYTFTLKMTARHVPKHCFQPTRLNGVIAQKVTMQSPQFIASCCHVALLLACNFKFVEKTEAGKMRAAGSFWETARRRYEQLQFAVWAFCRPVSHSSPVCCTALPNY